MTPKSKVIVSVKMLSKAQSVPVSIKMQNLITATHLLDTLSPSIDLNQHLLKSLNPFLSKKADVPVPTIPFLKFIIQRLPELKMSSNKPSLFCKELTPLHIKFKLFIKKPLKMTHLLYFLNS